MKLIWGAIYTRKNTVYAYYYDNFPLIKPTALLKSFFNSILSYFRAKETIIKDDLLAEEIIKSVKNNSANVNSIDDLNEQTTEGNVFDVLTAQFKIQETSVKPFMDTGASFTVISKKLAEKLNLCIDKQKVHNVSMADNNSVQTIGECFYIPIKVNDTIYPCKGLVVENLAQDLAIGNNWLAKYRVKIDLNEKIMEIPNGQKKETIKVHCTKLQNMILQ